MNFLAHAYLSGDNPALVVGGVVGDWIKGTLPGVLPADLARGVALHRAIDSFAESHLAFRNSRARVSTTRRRYCPGNHNFTATGDYIFAEKHNFSACPHQTAPFLGSIFFPHCSSGKDYFAPLKVWVKSFCERTAVHR